MRKTIIATLLTLLSCSAIAGKISYDRDKDLEELKSLLKEFSIPFNTQFKHNREWIIWPDEYDSKVNIIRQYGGGSLSTSKVDLLFELGLKDKGLSLLKKLATDGDSNAQHYLAMEYVIGRYINRDYQAANNWYKKAIKLGNYHSYTGLAVLYENGWGVNKNEKEALKLYKEAAKNNEKGAICKIGNFYKDGKAGLNPDENEANKYYKKVKDSSKYGFNCSKIQ